MSNDKEQRMNGRRVTEVENGYIAAALDEAGPGSYYGPVMGYTGDKSAVFFLLPNARDDDAPKGERSIHHVTSPPHTFHEEDDGTLTIHASILSPHGWHGYLERGVWREA